MNTLFPYNQPDLKRKDMLKKMLLQKHQEFYPKPQMSLLESLRKYMMIPLYGFILCFFGFGSIVGVEAFTSPSSLLYGKIYGPLAQLSFATKSVFSRTTLTEAPLLPGLTRAEMALLEESSSEQDKNYTLLSSKVARTLPPEEGKKIAPVDLSTQSTIQNSPLLLLTETKEGLLLSWTEQYLPSGALPAYYIVERALTPGVWKEMVRQASLTWLEKEPLMGTISYRVKIVDWRDVPLSHVLESSHTFTSSSTESKGDLTPEEKKEENTTSTIIEKKPQKSTEPVEYDYKDETQPLLDFHLALHAKVKDTKNFTLSWNKPSGVEIQGYNIYRDNIKRNVSLLKSTSFTDGDVLPGKTYQYQIRVVKPDGTEAGKSEKVSETFPLIAPAPTGLSAQIQGNNVEIIWNKSSVSGVKKYHISRKNITTGDLSTFTSTLPTYLDTTTISGNTYSYSVKTELLSGTLSPASSSISISKE